MVIFQLKSTYHGSETTDGNKDCLATGLIHDIHHSSLLDLYSTSDRYYNLVSIILSLAKGCYHIKL